MAYYHATPIIRLLLQLADHLEKGELGHKQFYIGCFNSGFPKNARFQHDPRLKRCNNKGCGLGECPFIFSQWWFNEAEQPVYGTLENSHVSACKFFDLDNAQFEHLFVHDRQVIERYGGQRLTKEATPVQMASNIRAFCATIESQHENDFT
jgi:hypothetical protein